MFVLLFAWTHIPVLTLEALDLLSRFPIHSISDVYYPILADGSSSIHVMKDNEDYDPSEHELGGFLAAPIYWRDLIKGILPEGSNGIVAVFENPCNPTFTYQVRS